MRTAARAMIRGAGFGLAMAALMTALAATRIMAFNMHAPRTMMVTGAGMAVVVGALLGLVFAVLLPRGAGRHAVAVALGWIAIELAVVPENLAFQVMAVLTPVVALGAVLLARRAPRTAATVAVLVVVAGVVVPELWAGRRTSAETVVRGTPPANAPDVVVVVLDTVRADHMSAYGYDRATTPNFDALAADGLLFLEAVSPATWSLPSHASLFTGRFPSAHGAHDEHRYLDAGSATLAATLAAAGWDTRSFTANAWISDGLGMVRGFAWTDEAWRHGDVARSMHSMHRVLDRLGVRPEDKGGAGVADGFVAWFRSRPADAPPAFVFLNFIEAHFPYHQLPGDWLHRFTDLPLPALRDLSLTLMAAQFGGAAPDVGDARVPVTAMYDAGVAYADALLGRVIGALRERGTLDRTIIVVLADHGELLGEHGEFGHGHSLYHPVLHVPLLRTLPARRRRGPRVAARVDGRRIRDDLRAARPRRAADGAGGLAAAREPWPPGPGAGAGRAVRVDARQRRAGWWRSAAAPRSPLPRVPRRYREARRRFRRRGLALRPRGRPGRASGPRAAPSRPREAPARRARRLGGRAGPARPRRRRHGDGAAHRSGRPGAPARPRLRRVSRAQPVYCARYQTFPNASCTDAVRSWNGRSAGAPSDVAPAAVARAYVASTSST